MSLLFALCASPAPAAAYAGVATAAANAAAVTQSPVASRPVTEAERTAFHAFYRKQFPMEHAEQPRFVIVRAAAAAPATATAPAQWSMSATVDRAPRRGYGQLCRMRRLAFSYADETRAWAVQERVRQFAWLNPAAGCAAPARPVELATPMPDTELAAILAQQGALLASARLLMAGNSACASRRAYPFALATVDVGAAAAGTEEMVALTYESDRATEATVWVRRNGAQYSAWNVACKASP